MERIKRSDIKSNNKEMLTSYHWDLVITKVPNAIYYPGDPIIQVRLKEVSGLPDRSPATLETKIRGFTLYQPGQMDNNAAGVVFTFADFEDQTIEAFILDYIYKSDNPSDHRSLHKQDLIMSCELFRLNSALEPVNKWILETGLITGSTLPNNYTSEKTILEGHAITMNFEYAEKVLLNT